MAKNWLCLYEQLHYCMYDRCGTRVWSSRVCMKILFLAADPSNAERGMCDLEMREIESALRHCPHSDSVTIIKGAAVRPKDLISLLLRHQPEVVHLSGHGTDSEVLLVDDDGHAKPVSKRALSDTFRALNDRIRLIFLNTCFSAQQLAELHEYLDFVIAMSQEIDAEAAIRFSSSFYEAIAYGRSIQNSFDTAKAALALQGDRNESVPRLLSRRGINPEKVSLFGSERRTPVVPEPRRQSVESVRYLGSVSQREPPIGQYNRPEEMLVAYARWARKNFEKIDMAGLGGGHLSLSLGDVSVPLRFHTRHRDSDGLRAGSRIDRDRQSEVDLLAAFNHSSPKRHLFILGPPGAGKTTALKRLLLATLDSNGHDYFDGSQIGLSNLVVPVFLRLRHLTPSDLRRSLGDLIDAQLITADGPPVSPGFGQWLWQRGQVLLLLDGLDEVVHPTTRAAVCEYIEREVALAEREHNTPGIHVVVSCRYAGVSGLVGFGHAFACLDILPLDDQEITRLATRWFVAAERAMALMNREDVEAAVTRGHARGLRLAEKLASQQHSSRRIKELVANPLLLTLLCVVVFDGRQIPDQRVDFFHDCLRTLLGRWTHGFTDEPRKPLLSFKDALMLLQPAAWALHLNQRKYDLDREELRQIIKPSLERLELKLRQPLTLGQVIDWLCRDCGVLKEYAPGEYGFLHLSLQEYLAAMHAAIYIDIGLTTLARNFADPWWREVILLFVALSEHRWFAQLARRVVATDKLLLCEELLRNCMEEAYAPDTDPFVEIVQSKDESSERRTAAMRIVLYQADERVRSVAIQILANEPKSSSLHALAAHIESRDKLSHQANEGHAFADETTGIRFLWIPGGRFRMGIEQPLQLWQWDEWAQPPHWVQVSSYWLAETPVTNQQYEIFVKATKHKEPEYWRDRRFNAADQPVVGVSWLDADKFCRWLKEVSGCNVVLPTEAQWEFAARGPASWLYPWGEKEPDETLAYYGKDYFEDQPLPVGSLPAGCGLFGTLDQAGNVLEWCRDVFDESAYKARGELTVDPCITRTDNPAYVTARAVRGGSFNERAQNLRAAYRLGDRMDVANYDLGFRIAILTRNG